MGKNVITTIVDVYRPSRKYMYNMSNLDDIMYTIISDVDSLQTLFG